MATTTCAKCGHRSFELKLIEPRSATYKQCVVQCTSCGVAIGLTDYRNPSVVVDEMEKTLKKGLARLESQIDDLARKVARALK